MVSESVNAAGREVTATTTVDSSTWGLYVHQAKDGTLTVVDSAGKAIASPPDVELTANGSLTVVDSSGVAQTGSETDPDGVVSESEEHNTDRNTKDQPHSGGDRFGSSAPIRQLCKTRSYSISESNYGLRLRTLLRGFAGERPSRTRQRHLLTDSG